MTEPAPSSLARQLTSDERNAAVARLSAAFADDVIPMEEFERRTTEVFRATRPAELAALLADLPAPEASAGSGDARGVSIVPAPQRVTAVFANVERGGPREVPGLLEVRAIFGNVELDLSSAHFSAGLTEIAVRAVCGNVEMRLPAGAIVENLGTGILASFTCHAPRSSAPADASAPVVRIRITGRAVLGNVEIETPRPKARSAEQLEAGGPETAA